MKKPQSPCLGCKERSGECHATCESYLQYVEDNKVFTDIVNKSKEEYDYGMTLLTLNNIKHKKPKKR